MREGTQSPYEICVYRKQPILEEHKPFRRLPNGNAAPLRCSVERLDEDENMSEIIEPPKNEVTINPWRFFTISFLIWVAAQLFGMSIAFGAKQWVADFSDTLFFLSAAPFGMLPFLDPDDRSGNFDKLHILDFMQVGVFWYQSSFGFLNERGPHQTPGLSARSYGRGTSLSMQSW